MNLKKNKISVTATSEYIKERSDPSIPLYLFSYHISIVNNEKIDIKLMRRHWDIIDGNGNTNIVNGDGVIGKQPLISPGENFMYSSFCPIPTDFGIMKGFYIVTDIQNQEYKIDIPAFNLIAPNSMN